MQDQVDTEESTFGKTALRVGLAGLIPLLTGAAYMAGWSYHHAYLAVFGIPAKLIGKSTSDYFVHAYMAMSETLLRLVSVTGLAILGLAVFAIYMWWAVGWLERRMQSSRRLRAVREHVSSRPFLRRMRDALLIPVFAVAAGYVAFGFLIVIVLPEALGQYAGHLRGQDDLSAFQDGCVKSRQSGRLCSMVFDGDKFVAEGFILDSSESYIAVYDKGMVRTFPVGGKHFISEPLISKVIR